jgi:catechol 2,3-dioxygenase-like lactoylglutathione lyase family enzyme
MDKKYKITIGHGAYYEPDFDRAINFWTERVGFRRKFDLNDVDGRVWLSYLEVTKGQFIESYVSREHSLIPISGGEEPVDFRPVLDRKFAHICYIVDDIVSYGRELQRKGVQLYFGPAFMGRKVEGKYDPDVIMDGTKTFYIEDPDGNAIEFMEYLPGCMQLKAPFVGDVEGVKWSIGHYSYAVGDFRNSLEFYTEMLGFEEKFSLYDDDGEMWITYLALGMGQFVELFPPRTAKLTTPYGQKMTHTPPETGMAHLCLVVDDIVRAGNNLIRRGVKLWDGPSSMEIRIDRPEEIKPTYCGSLTCFIDDASGNVVELMQYTDKSLQLRI